MKNMRIKTLAAALLLVGSMIGCYGMENREKKTSGELIAASILGDLAQVQQLVQEGACINEYDERGKTALHYAAEFGDLGVVRFLVNKGANVNAKCRSKSLSLKGDTPLHFAAFEGRLEVATVLVEGGANVEAVGANGEAPLHDVSGVGDSLGTFTFLFLMGGGGVNKKNALGETSLGFLMKEDKEKFYEFYKNFKSFIWWKKNVKELRKEHGYIDLCYKLVKKQISFAVWKKRVKRVLFGSRKNDFLNRISFVLKTCES